MKRSYVLILLVAAVYYSFADDNPGKEATIQLLTYSPKNHSFFGVFFKDLFSITGEGGRYWAVVAHFQDDDYNHVCQLNRTDTVDVGDWVCEQMTEVDMVKKAGHGSSLFHMGTLKSLTVDQLWAKCDEIMLGPNKIHRKNSQTFAKALIKKLGLSYFRFQIKRLLQRTPILDNLSFVPDVIPAISALNDNAS